MVLVPAVALIGCASSRSHTSDSLPDSITRSIEQRFPGAQIDEWTSDRDNGTLVYEVEFESADAEYEADLAADGRFLELEEEIELYAVPEAVMKALKSHAASAKLEDAARVSRFVDGREALVGYELTWTRDGGQEHETLISAEGVVIEDD
jgi:hypothetical protein